MRAGAVVAGGGGVADTVRRPCARTPKSYHRLPTVDLLDPKAVWHVAHTKPRQEKALGDSLLALEIACFVPLVRKVRYYAHRRRESELPLFPGYAFLHATREQVIEAYRTERVAQMLPVENQGLLEHELRQLDLALAGGADLDPFPGLGVGRRAAVTAGPFKGIEGTVDERLSSDRLILNVSMLGRAMSLEIDASLLEPVE